MPSEIVKKVVVIGPAGSGKTQLIQRLAHNKYSDEYKATNGVNFYWLTMNGEQVGLVADTEIKLQLWDVGGNNISQSMMRVYFQEAQAILFCVDFSDDDALAKAAKYYDAVMEQYPPKNISVYLVCTKNNKKSGEGLSKEAVQDFAKQHKIDPTKIIFSVSAKEETNIQHLKKTIVKDCLQFEIQTMSAAQMNSIVQLLKENKKVTEKDIKAALAKQTTLIEKLKFLEQAFQGLEQNKAAPSESVLSYFFELNNQEYSNKQLAVIALLKSSYIECIQAESYDKNNTTFNRKLCDMTAESKLVDFQQTRYKILLSEQTTTREIVDALVNGVDRPTSKLSL